jgi:ABC-type Fe3+/spermidine/putrescine transport system ATPase subunit
LERLLGLAPAMIGTTSGKLLSQRRAMTTTSGKLCRSWQALAIADRVAVLHSGRVAQSATPAEVYGRPADLTVARLTGPVSVLDAPLRSTAPGTITIEVGGVPATVPRDLPEPRLESPILMRPDWAVLDGDLPGLVTAVRFGGPHTDYEIETPAGAVPIRESGRNRRSGFRTRSGRQAP